MVRNYKPKSDGGARLWVTGTLGDPEAWQVSQHEWMRLENAFGCTFDKALRDEILDAVRRYLDWATAPGANDYLQKLERVRKLSRELRAAYVSLGDAKSLLAPHWERYFPREHDDDDAPAGDDLTALFDWAASVKPRRRGRDHRDSGEVLTTICGALDDACREAAHREGGLHSNRDTWRQLVSDLARAFMRAGIEATAHKNQYRELSPFVRFIKEINSLIPGAHPFTDDALAQAVARVINVKPKKVGQNRPGQRGKVVPPKTGK